VDEFPVRANPIDTFAIAHRGFLKHRGLLGLLLLSGACQWSLAAAEPTEAGDRNTPIYQRAKYIFEKANLFKPAQQKASGLEFDLAPLILEEVSQREGSPAADRQIGTLCLSNNVLSLDSSRPAVYVAADAVEVNARLHTRLSYFWFYSLAPQRAGNPILPIQGVRLTLDANGKPVVWEVLADDTSAELVFVSQSLESTASAEFSRPLTGRRFAIERGISEQPNIVVARVIEDGPQPMGPVVYLSEGTRAVNTLICRCMAAQAKSLLQTRTYELVAAGSGENGALLTQAKALVKAKGSFWLGNGRNDERLKTSLRLPQSF
jgi:hypothetical protein